MSIPNNLRVNVLAVEITAQGAPADPTYRNLIIGQKTADGAQAELVPVQVRDAVSARSYFGAGSMLERMCSAQLSANSLTETWAVALPEPSGAAASGSLTVAAAADANGAINLYIGGVRVGVEVEDGDSADAIAANIASAINGDAGLAVTAASTAGVVTLSAKNKGVVGNSIDLRLDHYDGEVSTVQPAIAAMSNGSGAPDLTALWAALGDVHYNIISNPYTDGASLLALEAELDSRWGPMRMIEGLAVSASTVGYADLTTLGSSRNSKHVSIAGLPGSPTPPEEIAAVLAGVVSYHASSDPARPFQTLKLSGVMAPQVSARLTNEERNMLLYDGIATLLALVDGSVQIERVITTYQTNGAGAADESYLDANSVLTLAYLRADFRTYIQAKYSRHKLADDGARMAAGQPVLTPGLGKSEAINKYRDWESRGLVEGFDAFKAGVTCVRNGATRLDWYLPVDIINQFRSGGATVNFAL